jgi:2-polyprenyl-3-methyl-5-hydroxy-6-metoxy-1,4-benzoquinol methylase
MKILAAIVNYGTANDAYLSRVLDEYRGMREDVDIVVTTNIAKNLGGDVEVVVGLPAKNPRSLAFAHKQILAERLEEYELFLYAEDDNLVTQRNIDAFLRATDVLPEKDIAGFLRTETDRKGVLYFSEPHHHYHWDASSVYSKGGYTFAFFTNEHAGFYALTKEQLRRAIRSGGYLVPFHHHKYPPLETAATDPYTQCGFRKMVCTSHLEDFLVPHLSAKYAGNGAQLGVHFYQQLRALETVSKNGKPKTTLFPVTTKIFHSHWSKNFYEPCQDKLIELVPVSARSVLSVGCGWGETEACLIEKGLRVKAVPIDSVIAANAEARGVEIVYGDAEQARKRLDLERFDCIIFSNVLHLVRDPVQVLASFAELLAPEGCLIASAPNVALIRRISRRLRFGKRANPKDYESSGMHASNGRLLRQWFRQAGLQPGKIIYETVETGKRTADELAVGLAKPVLGSNVYVSGSRLATRP